MLFPFVIVGLVTLIGYHVTTRRTPVRVKAGGWYRQGRPAPTVRRPLPRGDRRPPLSGSGYVAQLAQYVQVGYPPPPQLLQLAWAEAMQAGDVATASQVEQLAVQVAAPPQLQVAGDVIDTEAVETGEVNIGADLGEAGLADSGDSGPEGWGESLAATVTTVHHGQPNVQPQPVTPAPKEVTIPRPTGWDKFLAALCTREPGYQSDNYLGAYEHNRRRLRQLGIPESGLSTPEAQHQALCRDMDDYRNSCTKLLADWTGRAVDVNGQVISVTPSGVLGLLKAAGPRGAEGWLKNPEDRQAFPITTEVFTRCNGCF